MGMGFERQKHSRGQAPQEEPSKKGGHEFGAWNEVEDEVYYQDFGGLWYPDEAYYVEKFGNPPNENLIAAGRMGNLFVELWDEKNSPYWKEGKAPFALKSKARRKVGENENGPEYANKRLKVCDMKTPSPEESEANPHLMALCYNYNFKNKLLVCKNRWKLEEGDEGYDPDKDPKKPDFKLELFTNISDNKRKMEQARASDNKQGQRKRSF